MHEVLRTNDPVDLSYAQSLLNGAGIEHIVADVFTSVMEGSLGVLPRRILVEPDRAVEAADLLGAVGMPVSPQR